MTPEKYKRYQSLQNRPNVKAFEKVMTQKFDKMVRNYKLNNMTADGIDQVKNELAFKKLHPKSKISYMELINSE